MTDREFEKAMLVNFAAREVGPHGSLEQMKAVALCIRNRVNQGWGRWLDVIESAEDAAAHEPIKMRLKRDDRSLQMMLREVDDVVYGRMSAKPADSQSNGAGANLSLEDALCDPKSPALYWMFLKRPVRPWFSENIIQDKRNHPVRSTAGLMIFYE